MDEKEILERYAEVFTPPPAWKRRAEGMWLASITIAKERNHARRNASESLEKISAKYRDGQAILESEISRLDWRPFDMAVELLAGYAIELMLKAIWYCDNSGKVDPPWMGKGADGHHLIELGKYSNITWPDQERVQLEDLTEAIIWLGRYPTPFRKKEKTEWAYSGQIIESIYKSLLHRYAKSFTQFLTTVRIANPGDKTGGPFL